MPPSPAELDEELLELLEEEPMPGGPQAQAGAAATGPEADEEEEQLLELASEGEEAHQAAVGAARQV